MFCCENSLAINENNRFRCGDYVESNVLSTWMDNKYSKLSKIDRSLVHYLYDSTIKPYLTKTSDDICIDNAYKVSLQNIVNEEIVKFIKPMINDKKDYEISRFYENTCKLLLNSQKKYLEKNS